MTMISIIILTYNRAGFISEAIESALEQSFPDWELIVIDDASEDNTREIVEEYIVRDSRIKYFRNDEHLRISKSRNKALSLALGEYVAVLDSDDVWSDRDKLKKQYGFLEGNKDYVLIGGGVIVIDEYGKEIRRYFNRESDENIRGKILFQNQFAHSSVMFRREAALKAGGYDENLNIGEDYDLWLKLGALGKMANIKEYLLKYRVHSGNVTLKRVEALKNNIAIIRKYKNRYPNYYLAYARRALRLLMYRLIKFVG